MIDADSERESLHRERSQHVQVCERRFDDLKMFRENLQEELTVTAKLNISDVRETLTVPKLLMESSIILPAVILLVERDIEMINAMPRLSSQGIRCQSIM